MPSRRRHQVPQTADVGSCRWRRNAMPAPSFNATGAGWTSADDRTSPCRALSRGASASVVARVVHRMFRPPTCGTRAHIRYRCRPASRLRRRRGSGHAVSHKSTGSSRTRIRRAAPQNGSHRVHGRLLWGARSGTSLQPMHARTEVGTALRTWRPRPGMKLPDVPGSKGQAGQGSSRSLSRSQKRRPRGSVAASRSDIAARRANRGWPPGDDGDGASREALQARPAARLRPTPCGRSRRPAERLWRGLGRCGGALPPSGL
jgi:hypothetical protein